MKTEGARRNNTILDVFSQLLHSYLKKIKNKKKNKISFGVENESFNVVNI
jgi:hypothetical protein